MKLFKKSSTISRRDSRIIFIKSILTAFIASGVFVLFLHCELSKPIQGIDMLFITPFKGGLVLFFSTALLSTLSFKLLKTRSAFSPFMTAFTAIAFGFATLLIIGMLIQLLLKSDSSESKVCLYSAVALSMVAFISGTFICQRRAGEEPTTIRFISSLTICIIALMLLFYSTDIIFHPLRSHNPNRRLAWAKSNLGWHFTQAEVYLKSSKQVRADVGEVLDIYPSLTGENNARGGGGDLVAYFTLDVSGPKGKGIASVSVLLDNSSNGVLEAENAIMDAEWTFGESTLKLK